MANRNAPTGLRLMKNICAPNVSINQYVLPTTDGTATFVGDAVKSGGTASTAGVATIAQVAAGDTIRGVLVGLLPDATAQSLSLERLYRPASTLMGALVCDDPFAIFEIQEDAGGATTALVDVGENADIVVGAGSTTSGASGMQLDSSTHGTGTAQLRILGFVQRVDNTPASANAKLIVKINEHELTSVTGV